METTLIEKKDNEQRFYDGLISQKNTVRTEVKLVTPEMAKNWMTGNTMNRRINKSYVTHYARQMVNGLWTLTGEPIIFSNSHKLLDGQHRLLAVIESNTPVEFLVVFNVQEECFKDINTGKNRTVGDIFSITGIKNYNNIAAGLRRYLGLINKQTPSPGTVEQTSVSLFQAKTTAKELIDIYYKNQVLYDEIYNYAEGFYRGTRLLRISEYFAYVTYLHLHKKHTLSSVLGFFSQLSTGKNISNNSIYLLREKLINNKSKKEKLGGQVINIFLIKVWNNYIKGKEIKQLKFDFEREGKPEFI